MNRLHSSLLSAAVTGLFMGGSATLAGCGSEPESKPAGTNKVVGGEKHACKNLNSCEGKGGCSSGDKSCKGKNSCKGKGGCATVAHECAGKNACKEQGGCGSGDKKCAGKNTCKEKGGCKVPVQKH